MQVLPGAGVGRFGHVPESSQNPTMEPPEQIVPSIILNVTPPSLVKQPALIKPPAEAKN